MAGNGQIVRRKIKLWQNDEAAIILPGGKYCVRKFVEVVVTTE